MTKTFIQILEYKAKKFKKSNHEPLKDNEFLAKETKICYTIIDPIIFDNKKYIN
jgi:hypothetical protein